MKKQKVTRKILLGIFLLWIAAAGIKTLIHLKRSVNELTSIHSSGLREFFPNIRSCQPKPVNISNEENHLWEYRNMGAKCEN